MIDSNQPNHQKEEHEGASPSERIIEAARRNNTELLLEVINEAHSEGASSEAIASLLNTAKDRLGNYAYHVAASQGNWDIIDKLLDQEGFECDPITAREGDTPLHCVVRWINESGSENWEYGMELVEMMLEAGSDARIRNKGKLKPFDLVDPRNKALRDKLSEAEFMTQNAGDFVDVEEEEDDGPTGSNSDSDFDEDKE